MTIFARVSFSLLLAASASSAQTPSPTPGPSQIRTSNYVSATRGAFDDDKTYSPKIERPAYEKEGPAVLLDAAHRNLPLNQGLVRLLTADGYRVQLAKSALTYEALAKVNVLVIVNPGMVRSRQSLDQPEPPFTEAESAVIHDWVAGGGALLMGFDKIASDATAVVRRFQVEFSGDSLLDLGLHDLSADPRKLINPSIFSGDSELLTSHKIISGRSETERVRKVAMGSIGAVRQFPENAALLLRCSEGATLRPLDTLQMRELDAFLSAGKSNSQTDFKSSTASARAPVPAPRAAVAIAFTLGKGRVVMVSNGMFLSAMVGQITLNGESITQRTGLTEADNQQFTLNIMHWLSGLLD